MKKYGRVYENFPTWRLIRLKTFFLQCKIPFYIKTLNKFYIISSHLFGKTFVNKVIKYSYGDIFTSGENTKELEKSMNELKNSRCIGIADYAREFLSKEDEVKEIDNIIKMYLESIDISVKVDENNCIAIKISSFGNEESLRILNTYQFFLTLIEDGILNDVSSSEIINSLNKQNLKHPISEIDIDNIKNIFSNKISHFDLNLYEILIKDSQDLQILIQKIFQINSDEFEIIRNFAFKINQRLLTIFKHAENKCCLIMIDAEQSYLRYISDNIVACHFKEFNTKKCILSTTLQCYLKTQPFHLEKWNNFCLSNKLKFGLKLVRGAYMNQESKISREKGIENPICETFENTNNNYNKSIEFLFENYREGDKFCIATHNLKSIELVGKLFENEKNRNKNIICAQLLGIAEHTTGFSNQMNILNAKYLPFGNFDILIPYLIRRAEESTLVEKLSTQNKLLNEELFVRFISFFKYKPLPTKMELKSK